MTIPRLALEPIDGARYRFADLLGERVVHNTRRWLIPAPESNPGMIEMFRLRDRLPKPSLVPWAGEFVGKHLIASVEALRQDNDPQLRQSTAKLVRDLLSTQAEDGYLGPFPRAERLRGNWDLWGHYHCLLGLLLWHDYSGDAAALRGARRAADLICNTYLDTGRRVFDAGSAEMNMAVIHGLGRLYRVTGEPRYLRMVHEIEKDWERAGDYLRTGLAGEEFFRTPRPRWESLPDLQGLLELYQITGDARYRQAFEHHWRSILRWDRRNTGGFSSGEQATGDPYAETAIETCCTVAWMALTLDELRLTRDPRAADELELSTYNAAVGAQHPSGRWWTYNTPMDGVREASAHTIVFQARAGTPELNCCSVNGPRSLGMLSDWAVMRDGPGLAVNAYAPGSFAGTLGDGSPVTLRWETDYPRSGHVLLTVRPSKLRRFPLRLRVPGWSTHTVVRLNGHAVAGARAGTYLSLDRRWLPGDRIALDFDMRLRAVAGDREMLGKMSLYRGPLLLAYDQYDNAFDEDRLPAVNLSRLGAAKLLPGSGHWALLEIPAADGRHLRLRDFAGAGSHGTHYRSWLPVSAPLPPPVVTREPLDGQAVPTGKLRFRWTGPSAPNTFVRQYRLEISTDPEFQHRAVEVAGEHTNWAILDAPLRSLAPERTYWWRVAAVNEQGVSLPVGPAARFTIDPKLPPLTDAQLRPPLSGGVLVSDALAGAPKPDPGVLLSARAQHSVPGPGEGPEGAVAVDGVNGRVIYRLDAFPEEEYTVVLRVRLDALPEGRLGQLFSAWTAPNDDPLRLCIDGGRLFARIESGSGAGTAGFPVQAGRWYGIVAVKEGARLRLFVDGALVGESAAPYVVHSASREVALGANPRYPGNEYLAASFAAFSLHARAFSSEEAMRASRLP